MHSPENIGQKKRLKVCIIISQLIDNSTIQKYGRYIKNGTLFISLIVLIIFLRYFQVRPEYLPRDETSTWFNSQSFKKDGLFNVYMQMKKVTSLLAFNYNDQVNEGYVKDQSIVGKFTFTQTNECLQNSSNCVKFRYFNFYKHTPPIPIDCPRKSAKPEKFDDLSNFLIIQAPFKTPSVEAPLGFIRSFYDKASKICPYPYNLYILKRKDHLNLGQQNLIQNYSIEIKAAIRHLSGFRRDKLSILTFQEGSILLLKSFLYLSPMAFKSIDKILFINAYSPDIRILNQQGWKYIEKIKNELLLNSLNSKKEINHSSLHYKKIKALNQTKMVFINTWKYNNYSPKVWPHLEMKYRFLFQSTNQYQEKQLITFAKTAFIQTRLMHNVHTLLSPRDYFMHANFLNAIVSYFVNDKVVNVQTTTNQQQSNTDFIRTTELYFYDNAPQRPIINLQAMDQIGSYHQLLPHFNELTNKQKQVLRKQNLHYVNVTHFYKNKKIPLPYYNIKIYTEWIEKQMESRHLALYIYGSRSMEVYNDQMEVLNKRYEGRDQSYYIIQKLVNSSTKFLLIKNKENRLCYIRFIPIYSPIDNPILSSEIIEQIRNSASKPINSQVSKFLQFFSLPENPSLLTICPYNHRLLYPQQFSRRSLQQYTIATQHLLIPSNKSTSQESLNCYMDINNYDIVSQTMLHHWTIQINIIVFTLMCSYITKKKTQHRYFVQLLINFILTFIVALQYEKSQRIYLCMVNFLILAFVILIEKLMEIAILLASFPQEYTSMTSQRIMLGMTLLISVLKYPFESYLVDISAYKVMLLSIIFLINHYNIIPLMIKIYYMAEIITFNHNIVMNVFMIVFWIYGSLIEKQYTQKSVSSVRNVRGKYSKITRPKIQLKKQVTILEYVMICSIAVCLDGPMLSVQSAINYYMILKTMKTFYIQANQ